ncbi:MAG: hypothetical protein ACYTEQ_25945 [Planctomycetota bacterium]|jgi:hypothetical protein
MTDQRDKDGTVIATFELGTPKPQPVVGDESCPHVPDIQACVDVTYLEDSGRWTADVKIECGKCGVPFRFLGVPGGMSFKYPMASIDGQELRAPIEPAHVSRLVGLKGP